MDEGFKGNSHRLVGRRYQLLREIGKGGMARVWLARQLDSERSDQLVAIKEPVDVEPGKISRFYREARAHWLLRDSPHIVRMHGFEHPEPNPPYLVLEYMQGGSLKELLGDFRKLTVEAGRVRSGMPRPLALKLAHQAARALSFMHQNNFAHRDLKPSNLLLKEARSTIVATGDGTLHLSDLGIVDDETIGGPDETQQGTMVGTWPYAPPEYLELLSTDSDTRRSIESAKQGDVYALGLILYEIWMGYPLYDLLTSTSSNTSTAKNAQKALKKLEVGLERLEGKLHELRDDEVVYGLLAKMLMRNPEKRIKMEAVEQELRVLAVDTLHAASTYSAGQVQRLTLKERWTHFLHSKSLKPPQWVSTLALLGLSMVGGWWLRAVDLSAVMPPQAPNAQVQDATKASENALTVAESTPPAAPSPSLVSPPPLRAVPAPAPAKPLPQTIAKAKPSPENDVVQSLDTMPIESAADAAFIEDLQKKKLLPAVDVKLPHSLDDESLKLMIGRSKPIRAPGETLWAAYSTNARIDDEKAGAVAVLLRHGESNYYSTVKGFGPVPKRQASFQSGETLGASREAMPVIQELVHCPQPLTKWGDLKRVKCRPIAPRVWVKP